MTAFYLGSSKKTTTIEVDTWTDCFEVIPREIFDKAVRDYMKSARFMPKPCEIVPYIMAILVDFRSKYFWEKYLRTTDDEEKTEQPQMTDEEFAYYETQMKILDDWEESQETGKVPRGGFKND